MPAVEGVRVEGLRELQRGLKNVGSDFSKKLRGELRAAGESVRSLAESKAESNIRNIGASWARGSLRNVGAPWARMRVGVTATMVYVAPMSRNQGGSPRPNLGGLLMTRALIPAADERQDETLLAVEHLLDVVAAENGFF